MEQNAVIDFRNVKKRFRLGGGRNRSVFEMLTRRAKPSAENTLWAVNDVSFRVKPGESIGLIGHNGSGKSTLLKLVTQILQPTSGDIFVNGRISPLLELGAGFHADLTGRENIYLNGSVLGLSNPEIDARIDEIIAFSELEQFIDIPVKHYSSGMYMRLGFSVAVHCDPEILLVDEILAVGDRAFQKKCLTRINLLKQQGVTIMMVSHNLPVLLKLCDTIIWMDKGHMREVGDPSVLINRYIEHMNEIVEQRSHDAPNADRTGTFEVEIVDVRFLDGEGQAAATFTSGKPMTIEMHYVAHEPIEDPEFGLAFFRSDGLMVAGPNNRHANYEISQVEGEGVVRFVIPFLPLLPDRYTVTTAIHGDKRLLPFDSHDHAYTLNVVGGGNEIRHGTVDIPAQWEWDPSGSRTLAES